MEFIDTHCHFCDPVYDQDREEVIAKAIEAGVSHMLQADVDSSDRPAMLALCREHPDCLHPMVGFYPGSVTEENWQRELDMVVATYRDSGSSAGMTRFVAVGEIGLDYHYGKETADLQKKVLRTQLELASEWDLPVNIHLREAEGDFFDIISDCDHLHLRGNLHAFSASAEFFRQVSRHGDWRVGVGGVLTFKKARIAREILDIPLDRILLETDAPYLTPTPHRGERNDSSYIPLIAAYLAEIKGVPVDTAASVTTASAKQLFAI